LKKFTKNKLKIDWLILLIFAILVIFGLLNLYSTTSSLSSTSKQLFNLQSIYGNQLKWILISVFFGILIFIINYQIFNLFAHIFYIFGIILLILVLIFGIEIRDTKAWIKIMNFNFQPSEFVKITTSLGLAYFISEHNITHFNFKNLLKCSILIFLPAALILMQPDTGTALVFFSFLIVLYREGMPGWILISLFYIAVVFILSLKYPFHITINILLFSSIIFYGLLSKNGKHLIVALAIFIITFILTSFFNKKFFHFEKSIINYTFFVLTAFIFIIFKFVYKLKHYILLILIFLASASFSYSVDFVFDKFLKPHQQSRIKVMLGIETDTKKYGYNLNQSKIAIGSGGFSGKGFHKGTQTKLNFVPEQSTDFIFCTVGEEWGFLGSFFLLLLYFILIKRIIDISERQKSRFIRIYGYCVASIIFFHVAINIGMTIGLFPIIGIPLPFFSYGGSSIIAFSLLLFIFLRLTSVRTLFA